MVRILVIVLLAVVGVNAAAGSVWAQRPRGPTLKLRELRLRRPGSADTMAVDRRVQIAVEAGWTGEFESRGRAVRLYGPEGEGKMLIAAALHPSELGQYLSELKREHPSAAPLPPQKLDLPGIRPMMGERATRFVIKGREVGEMVLIEKQATIVLIVTVVDPRAWPRIRRELAKSYRTLIIRDAKPKK